MLWTESKFGEKVQITVTLTNELPPSSPVCLQFYNIIFRRYEEMSAISSKSYRLTIHAQVFNFVFRILKILNMQQIGRHYYNPDDPLNIPQHRYSLFVRTYKSYTSAGLKHWAKSVSDEYCFIGVRAELIYLMCGCGHSTCILSCRCRLTIWPGFVTNILQYESSIMLCVDVSHKVLRSETVLDFMACQRQQCGDQRFVDACTKELVGVIVLTK